MVNRQRKLLREILEWFAVIACTAVFILLVISMAKKSEEVRVIIYDDDGKVEREYRMQRLQLNVYGGQVVEEKDSG